ILRRMLVPKSVRTRIRKARSMQERPQLTPDITAKLTHIYLEDRMQLARFFPAHPALQLCYSFAES
ncbi:MAG: sulfotransferase, partial [Actinomycetota bacterium]